MINLKQIDSKEAMKYKLLGRAFGIDLDHCIYEGVLHCENFEKRVKYYVIISYIKSDNPEARFFTNKNEVTIVEFYED